MSLITKKNHRRDVASLWGGFLGGNIASLVKFGSEVPFPPRTPDRASPPIELLQDLGIQAQNWVYSYSNHVINFAACGFHHLFSIFFAMLYAFMAEICPKIKLWQGAAFGFVITIVFHGIALPIFKLAPPIWNLPSAELFSETVGHILWAWTIEVFRRDIRNRITEESDAF